MMTLIVSILVLAVPPPAAEPAPVFAADFEKPDALEAWTGTAEIVDGCKGTRSLMIRNTRAAASATVAAAVPADRIAGKLVTIAAAVRAAGVTEPPNHWNGIKVMLVLETGTGRQYPQVPLGTGTFDWTVARHTLRVPREITKATLVLGLERAAGTAWFDEVRVITGRPARGGRRFAKRFTGHDLPRLRGVMHGPRFVAKDLRELAEDWKANQVRWQLNWTPMKKAEQWAADLDRYDAWLAGALADLEKAMDACERHGILMLVDLHCPPGGRAKGGVCRLFTEKRYREKFIAAWDRIARQCRGRQCVYAYDLINEPVEPPPSDAAITWPALATRAIDAIRAVDPGMPVVFEPGPWGTCAGFDTIVPLHRERVIYSFHMYHPHAFTHQGVYGNKRGVAYPGTVNGLRWDKERLREAMAPAIAFQEAFNIQVYVGEFSAIRWAPDHGAYRYLRDCIDLFEEYGWDWSYHAFREWQGWSVEHTTDPENAAPAATPTRREKLLKQWFARNKKPW